MSENDVGNNRVLNMLDTICYASVLDISLEDLLKVKNIDDKEIFKHFYVERWKREDRGAIH
ncbi:hypothetical protein [Psychrobacillus lasiicapitis]|uniref:hypothetical protein n=1 Tax=Psychrobacillus lasiicapitis TaxID=1636719 RepID=UPI001B87B45A|nr:hypothetical protein [Psychrobacillus lasiicapitis]